PNHTSIEHPWFRERPDLYVWADEVPNNWRAAFGGGSAWTLDPDRGRYYLHNFAREQPDLDWWNPEVCAEFERILRFWFDRGVAGRRLAVLDRVEPRRRPADDALVPRRRGARTLCAARAAHAARRRLPLLRRRAGARRGARAAGPDSGRRRSSARSGTYSDAVDARGRHGRPRARACRRRRRHLRLIRVPPFGRCA